MEAVQPSLFIKPTLKESKLQAAWSEVKLRNPGLLPELARLAKELQSYGHQRYSMDGLFHILRWETRTSTGDCGLKVNNSYTAFAARDIMLAYPELAGFFELRTQKPRGVEGHIS